MTSDLTFYRTQLQKYAAFADMDRTFDGVWDAAREFRTKLNNEAKMNNARSLGSKDGSKSGGLRDSGSYSSKSNKSKSTR